jgi:hypothetical protein
MEQQTTDTRQWRRERVLRRLLDPAFGGKTPSLYHIAKDAKMSYSWVHTIAQDLVQIGALSKADDGTVKLVRPEQAYTYWRSNHPSRTFAEYQVSDPLALLQSTSLHYAATTYYADNAIQGYLFPRRADIYIRLSDAEKWHAELTKSGFVGAGNFRIIVADPDLVEEVMPVPGAKKANITTVRVPQLILDLLEEGGPCTEAARLLMEKTYA